MQLNIKPTTDFDLPWYDYSTLNAIEQCPRRGLIQYRHNKHISEHEVSDNILAGSAFHRFCAAYNSYKTNLTPFSPEETQLLVAASEPAENEETARLCYATEAIYMGDLPSGEKVGKSLANVERSSFFWADQQKHGCDIIDVEYPFDITINDEFRYVGVIDCIQAKNGIVFPTEYKTAAQINDGYLSQWFLNHQLTGYSIALRCLFEHGCLRDSSLTGVADYVILEAIQLPIPKQSRSGNPAHIREVYKRNDVHIEAWYDFVIGNKRTAELYTEKPWAAPIHTHSCFSYFTTCQFIDFCQQTEQDRREIFENELVTQIWDPTEK